MRYLPSYLLFSLYIRNHLWAKRRVFNILLLPLSLIYWSLTQIHRRLISTNKIDAPVICIGNVTAGGTGKTPTAIAIAKICEDIGYKVAFISSGYKSSLYKKTTAIKVNIANHNSRDVGDEALLLAKIAPTYIAKNRYLAAKKALEDGASIVIMDDGLQNYTLYQDIKILLIDGKYKLGNNYLIPAGPMRETFDSALKKTDLIVYVESEGFQFSLVELLSFGNINNALMISSKRVTLNSEELNGQSVVLMCGIGNPESFIKSAIAAGVVIKKQFIFPDHFDYTEVIVDEIVKCAQRLNSVALTTEKDFVKIPKQYHNLIRTLKISIKFEDEGSLKAFLKDRLLFNGLKK